jgi:hypothetical protein
LSIHSSAFIAGVFNLSTRPASSVQRQTSERRMRYSGVASTVP